MEIMRRASNRSEPLVALAQRLKEARLSAGLTQADVASRAGIRSTSISEWETGSVEPSVDSLLKVADVVGLDVLVRRGPSPRRSPFEVVLRVERALSASERKRIREVVAALLGEAVVEVGFETVTEPLVAIRWIERPLAAGHGGDVHAKATVRDPLNVPVEVVAGRESAMLRAVEVRGDSMTPGIPDGSVALVDLSRSDVHRSSGRLVAAEVEGEEAVLVKRLRLGSKGAALESTNPAHPPRRFTPGKPPSIRGVVVAVLLPDGTWRQEP